MAPLTKDSVEAANPATEATVPQSGALPKQAPAGGGHLRADALSLEVPVKVHGSRVTEVARGVAPRTEPFEEQTSTMIVFPQGAVLRMSTAVSASQMLVVTNLKTRQDAICRVIKVRTFSNMQGYVEVEFTHKQPGYWGVNFPSEGPAPSSQAAPAIPAVPPIGIPESPAKTSPVQNASPIPANLPIAGPATTAPHADSILPNVKPVVPAPPPAPVVAPPPVVPAPTTFIPAASTAVIPPSKPEPNFAPIGTQEEVQPAASATSPAAVKFVAPVRPVASAPVSAPPHTERVREKVVPEIPKPNIAAQALAEANIEITPAPVAPVSLSLNDLGGDEPAAGGVLVADSGLAVEEKGEASSQTASLSGSSRVTFGSFSGGAALGSGRGAPADTFGARLDGSLETSDSHPSQPRGSNWMLIAACVAVLFVGVFGGVFYFRTQSANSANSSSAPKVNSPAVPQSLAFQSPSVIPDQSVSSSALAHNSAANPIAIVTQSNAPAASVSAGSAASGSGPRVVVPEKQSSKITADMVKQQLDQHPVAPQRSDAGQTDAAPAVDAAPAADSSDTGALSGIISSNVAAPAAPEIRPDADGPVKVGGNVKEPRLVSRAMPEYPLVAKEAGIQGDVVMKTTIDAKGNVVNVQVVSGPQMLRGPAMAALRRWKYQPSTLNGQPIAVQMLVTIKFSR